MSLACANTYLKAVIEEILVSKYPILFLLNKCPTCIKFQCSCTSPF